MVSNLRRLKDMRYRALVVALLGANSAVGQPSTPLTAAAQSALIRSTMQASVDRQKLATHILPQRTADVFQHQIATVQRSSASIARQVSTVSRQISAMRVPPHAPLAAAVWTNSPIDDGLQVPLLAASSFAANFDPPPFCPQVPAPALAQMITTASQRSGVDASLVREVARQESAFRPCSISSKGAEGLMQLMPATQAMLGVSDPFDPQQSLTGGATLLRTLLLKYGGNVALALGAYNAGSGTVDRAGGVPDIQETQDYVATIMGRLGK